MTEHSFVEAVDAGTNVFFGFEGENIANAVGSSLLNVIQSPGYYAVVVRSILRSANTILNEISDAFSSGSFVESLQAVVGLVDVLKSSKVFAYFNMLAQLGDLELTKIDNGIIEKVGQKKNASAIDDIDDVAPSDVFGMVQKPRASVMKSRIKSSDPDRAGSMDLRLSWRASSSPALYILPETFLRAGTDFGGNAEPKTILTSDLINKTVVTQAQKRLDSSQVEALEDAMEAEYVPFYFHDLRTNEIVSFHAFLASLNDSFTSNYESVDGYGRIEPVRIYRSTERSIDFSFHVAATSEADFDEMWWKINKIVTLLYPQWSPGRQLENTETGGSFRQPFSQIPTSSPLIRLRIGDVIKSNYSKFNLSRLFGLGSGDESFKIDGYLEGNVSPKLVEKIQKQALTIRRLRSKEFVQGDKLNLRPSSRKGYEPAPAEGQVLGSVKVTEQTKVLVLKETSSTIKDKKKGDIDVKTFIVKRSDGEPFTDRQGEKVKEIIVTAESLDASPDALKVDDNLADLIVQDQGSIEAVQEFFNSEQNSIVRAFDSAKGRGLAGVITSMNFDWYTPTWETEIVGSKAPQYCLVNISFSPIHDIPPGIDSDGFNRAPVYPVGRIVNSAFGDIRDDKDRETLAEEANLNRAKGIF
jgi:hypothetical protein